MYNTGTYGLHNYNTTGVVVSPAETGGADKKRRRIRQVPFTQQFKIRGIRTQPFIQKFKIVGIRTSRFINAPVEIAASKLDNFGFHFTLSGQKRQDFNTVFMMGCKNRFDANFEISGIRLIILLDMSIKGSVHCDFDLFTFITGTKTRRIRFDKSLLGTKQNSFIQQSLITGNRDVKELVKALNILSILDDIE